VIYLDTHALIYVGAGELNRLGAASRKAIDRSDVVVSAAVVLELELLHEIGRLKPTASKLVAMLANDIGARVRSAFPENCRPRASRRLDTRSIRSADRRERQGGRRSAGHQE
jgi:hypothetical protein